MMEHYEEGSSQIDVLEEDCSGDIWSLMSSSAMNNTSNLLFSDFHSELHDYLQNTTFEKLDLARLLSMDELIQELAVADETAVLVRFLAQADVMRELILFLVSNHPQHQQKHQNCDDDSVSGVESEILSDSQSTMNGNYYTVSDDIQKSSSSSLSIFSSDFYSIKAPYMAAQVLCSNVPAILVALVNNDELLNLLLSEISDKLKINVNAADRLAGYLENILDTLFSKHSTEMGDFISSKIDRFYDHPSNDVEDICTDDLTPNLSIIKLLLPHLHCYAVSRIVLKLLNTVDICVVEDEMSSDNSEDNTTDDEIHSNDTDDLRCKDLLKCPTNGCFKGFQLILEKFTMAMNLDDDFSIETQINCTKILDQLLDITDNLVRLLTNKELLSKVTVSLPLFQSVLRKYLRQKDDITDGNLNIIQSNVFDVLNKGSILHDINDNNLLDVTKIVESLLTIATEEIWNCVKTSSVLDVLIDRFFVYSEYNIFHCYVSTIIERILASNYEPLLAFLLKDIKLPLRLIAAFEQNKKNELDGGFRLGYMVSLFW